MRSNRIALSLLVTRAVPLGLLWWVLTGGARGWDAWLIGVPAVLLSAALSAALLPPVRFSFAGTVRFAAFFLWESWRGAVDVARRALDPRMPIAPDLIRYGLAPRREIDRVAVATTSSLLPGTLSVDLDETAMYVHILDAQSPDAMRVIDATETRVAEMMRARDVVPPAHSPRRRRR